jgi:hypothetical protein
MKKPKRCSIIANKIHDEWCIENGYSIKIEAPSFKQQASSVKPVDVITLNMYNTNNFVNYEDQETNRKN